MRKRRAVIYDDDDIILNVLNEYFTARNYEVVTYQEPVICPIVSDKAVCSSLSACADIVITDFMMPIMNGIELLKAQARGGCKVPINNKALISGNESMALGAIHEIGCAFFKKPFSLGQLSTWLSERESQMDLSQPLAIKRKEQRNLNTKEVTYSVPPNATNHIGIVVNMSPSGLCVKTFSPLNQGQSVVVHFGQFALSRAAMVLWGKEIEHEVYMAGLSFM